MRPSRPTSWSGRALCPGLLALATVLASGTPLAQADPAATEGAVARGDDGRILDRRPCAPLPVWQVLHRWRRQRGYPAAAIPERGTYERVASELRCEQVRYRSGGLAVAGFIYRSKRHTQKRQPVLVYARGGNGAFGQLPAHALPELLPFVDAGYIVVATQYRGCDGGEGREQFGGDDLGDLLSLFPLARRLEGADPDNTYLLGFSRGGMMVLLALARGVSVRAAAVIGAPTDLRSDVHREEMTEAVYRRLIPDFDRREDAALRARSAVEWAEQIAAPLLIIHGEDDDRVSSGDALRLASRLDTVGTPYQLVIYPHAGHAAGEVAAHRDQQILGWFTRFRRGPGTTGTAGSAPIP